MHDAVFQFAFDFDHISGHEHLALAISLENNII
jgi:hypothetical protein